MIVCCGEALIDMLPRVTKEGLPAYLPMNGGSIFNTAIALGRQGVPTGFYSGLSTDFFGDSLKAGLSASHVSLKYVKVWDRPSTLAFVKLDNGQARYSFFDDNSAGRMLTRKDLPKLAKDVEALHFGSISLIPEPGGATLEALMKRECKTRVISFDPNIRPTVIVKWITGKSDFAAAAKKWLKAGAKLVVITKGGEGVEAFTKAFSIRQSSVIVNVVDTVGAGDTFTAGLLASLRKAGRLTKKRITALDEETLKSCLSFAAKAAAITCSRPGADPPWAHELSG
jgi:fructokinase